MDITNILTYDNLSISILDIASNNTISGWSLNKKKYTTEKIISCNPTKVDTYYIVNGIKFYINAEVLIKVDDEIKSAFVKDLYDEFINNKTISVLNYQLEDVLITDFIFEERTSVKNRCTFLNVIVYGNTIYLPYSKYSILIRGALFI
jgi:hypothetical protein